MVLPLSRAAMVARTSLPLHLALLQATVSSKATLPSISKAVMANSKATHPSNNTVLLLSNRVVTPLNRAMELLPSLLATKTEAYVNFADWKLQPGSGNADVA